MKKIINLFLLLLPVLAFGQTFPVNNLTVNGTSVHTGLATFNGGATVNGGATINGGTTVTGSFTATGLVTTPDLATQAANSILGNFTGGVASPTAVALGTGVPAALQVSTNTANGIPLVVGSIASGDCLKWSAGVQDAGTCYDTNILNVRTYGALGNSNGTHLNGNDDTTAFQNALNASASTTLYIPCGTYRITAPINITDAAPRWIFGNGQCTKIYSDQSSAGITFNFNPAGTCGAGSNAPCLVMANLVFLTPNTIGGGQVAVYLSKTNSPYIDNVSFVGQQVGVQLVNSFAPRIHNSRFYGGVAGIFGQDISLNSGEIWSNSFFNQTQGISVLPASNCAVAVSIRNNDMENNGTAMILSGICSGDISNNYLEAIHTQTIFNFGSSGGGLQNVTFYNNSINGATDSGTGSEQITNLLSSQFVNNSFFNWTVTYGTGVGRVRLRASENYLVATTLPTVSMGTCTGLGTGGTCSIITGDDWAGEIQLNTGTSPASSGTIGLNFSNALGPFHAHCNFFPINNAAGWTPPTTLIGTSGAPASTTANWTNGAALIASSNVLLAYSCQGY